MRRTNKVFKTLLLKTLYDKRWFFVGWTVGSITLLALTAAFYPSIAATVGDLLKSIPSALSNIVGEAGAYSTYEGYLGSAVFGLRAEMVFVPLAIILGLSLSVNEELSRRMYQLLAQPLSRRRIMTERWLAGILLIVAMMALIYVSLVITSFVVSEAVPYDSLAKMALLSGLYTVAIFSLTYGVGMALGRRGLAIIIPVLWVMGSLLLDSFGSQVEWLKHTDWLSVHHYYNTAALAQDPITLESVLVLSGVSLLSFVFAVLLFQQRDIREAE